jgi:hypothetical protein
MKEKFRKHGISLVVMAFFALLAFGSLNSDTDTKKVQSQAPSYILSANQLVSEFKANEVAASAKYKGQVVVVSGTIESIGIDIMDNAYVVIGNQGFLAGVQCTFTRGEKSSVALLSKGQRVRIKGEVSGKMGNVLLNKCTLQ